MRKKHFVGGEDFRCAGKQLVFSTCLLTPPPAEGAPAPVPRNRMSENVPAGSERGFPPQKGSEITLVNLREKGGGEKRRAKRISNKITGSGIAVQVQEER